jgi:hypothetical protein
MSGMKSLDLMAEETNQHISREQSPLLYPKAPTIIGKRHDWKGVAESDKVIFVLRNYKEAIIRNNTGKRRLTVDTIKNVSYIHLLKKYDEFNGEKMLIYYEDLINPDSYITDERDLLKDIATFLEIEEINSHKFVENYQEHKTKSLTFYPRSQTSGNSNNYHTKRFNNKDLLNEWKEYLKDVHTDLYNKYLFKYD